MALKDVGGFNPLEVFQHPKQAVETALEFPSIVLAISILILYWVLVFVSGIVSGLDYNFLQQAAAMAVGIAVFFIQAWLVFIIAKGFGNSQRKLFEGIISAFSLAVLATIVLSLFMLAVLILNPQIPALINDWSQGKIQDFDLINLAWDSIMQNIILGIITLIIGVILAVWMGFLILYMNFLTIAKSTKSSVLISVLLMIIVFVFCSFIQSLANSIIAMV